MIKVLSLVATCMAVISFSGFAAEAPSTAAANPYEQNIVRLSKITVAPEYLDQYKALQIKRLTNIISRRLTSGSTRKEHCIW